MKSTLAPIIEAAYAPGEDAAWLEHLLHAVRPVLDAGLGVVGFFYDLRDAGAPLLRAPTLLGTPPGAREALERIANDAPQSLIGLVHRLVPSCTTMSERLGLGSALVDLPLHRSTLAPLGIVDFLGVGTTEASGAGCLVGAPLPRVTSMSSLDRPALTAMAAHVTAGMWMRRQSGVWAALVVPAPMRSVDRPLLTSREEEVVARAAKGHGNGRIAEELGLAPSTVAGHLTRAAAKLGARSRVELMRAYVASPVAGRAK